MTTFTERVTALGINLDALQEVRIATSPVTVIPNKEGKFNSLQVFAAITNKYGVIGVDEAKTGLEVFGEELRKEARENPGKHSSIDLLEKIVKTGVAVKSEVVRKPLSKTVPPSVAKKIIEMANTIETPFYVYDEKGIRDIAKRLKKAFSWSKGFKNYFAVKACPNPNILRVLKEEGFGTDCSSLPELEMSQRVGITGENIMFTSNDTPAEELKRTKELGGIINLDDITYIDFLEKHAGIPELICFRYNPGPARTGNVLIGNPQEAKYGLTRDQIIKAYGIMKKKGVKRFGLHTMVISNELNPNYFVETARMLFDLVAEVSEKTGVRFEFVNMGGGIGIPYRPEQKPVDLELVGQGVKKAYEEMIVAKGLEPLKIFLECGRLITGPHGYLVSKVRHVTAKYKDFVGVDACMANLMRPGMYNAYHHITVLGREAGPFENIYDVTGSLCENNDKFAIDRRLPKIEQGDIIVIHDSGAHGHSMGFNYNGKLRSAEYLLRENGEAVLIRRAETMEDYFDTLAWNALG